MKRPFSPPYSCEFATLSVTGSKSKKEPFNFLFRKNIYFVIMYLDILYMSAVLVFQCMEQYSIIIQRDSVTRFITSGFLCVIFTKAPNYFISSFQFLKKFLEDICN
jgi:hypothetical protein